MSQPNINAEKISGAAGKIFSTLKFMVICWLVVAGGITVLSAIFVIALMALAIQIF